MDCKKHAQHEHSHGPGCGHIAIRHGDQTAYLHDGHMHVSHGDHVDDVALALSGRNPGGCTPEHACSEHDSQHKHGPNCGHQQVPHGDHTDYLVGSHLHHAHDGHCDDHGQVDLERGTIAA